jgi:hypothetical protein
MKSRRVFVVAAAALPSFFLPGGFCPVCRRAIGRAIDEYSRP